MEEIIVPSKANIRVYWDDTPENYSSEEKNKVRDYFSSKYKIPRNAVNVVFRPVKIDKNGETIEITGSGVDNIMDLNYQHQLFKEWLKNENITVDFDRLLVLDKKVNESIEFNNDDKLHRNWRLLKMEINNFLCFGTGNSVEFENLKGINIVESSPRNMGGKTTFSVDSLMFLFFGTTTKTEKNEEIFNQYSKNDIVDLKGVIDISGTVFSIQRIMKRTLKKDGTGYTIKNTVNYYEVLNDGTERSLDDADGIKTTQTIIDTIGNESDFMTIIMATADNLDDLIETQATARGKLLTRFIGLEIIEKKEQSARLMYNTFAKSMKSNQYNSSTLVNEITEHEENIKLLKESLIVNESKLDGIKANLIILNEKKDKALTNKQDIDKDIISLDPNKLKREIEEITTKGKTQSSNIEDYNKRISEIGDVRFDEILYESKLNEERNIKLNIERDTREKNSLISANIDLINSGICPTCKQTLVGVDHTDHINNNKDKIDVLTQNVFDNIHLLSDIGTELETIKAIKVLCDEKDKLELKRDRCEVEVTSLRADLKSKKLDIKRYESNNSFIELNRKLDIEITGLTGQIQRDNGDKDMLSNKIVKCNSEIEQHNLNIENKRKIIDIINKESKVEQIYKVYIDMVGKKGISKIVLRSVIPIINFELHRLLDDVVDFNVELEINSKNEVDFIVSRDDVRKLLRSGSGFEKTVSAIALRCVLSRVSNLPKPNFIGFDEVLGKVANENLTYVKLLFDNIKNIFDIVFLITHNDNISDWADNIITIKKIDNISSILIK